MNWHLNQSYSLKSILLLCFISIAILPVILISAFFYYSVNADLENNTAKHSRLVLESTAAKVDTRIDQINEFSNWLCKDPVIANIFLKPSNNPYSQDIQLTIENLEKQFQYRPVTEYILSLFIIGDGVDIRHGQEASLINAEPLRQIKPFHQGRAIYWGEISKNPTPLSEYPEIIPYSRQITDSYGNPLGQLILLLNPTIFTDECVNLDVVDGAAYAIVQESGHIIICNPQWRDSSKNLTLSGHNTQSPIYLSSSTAKDTLVMQERIRKSNWIIIQTLPPDYIGQQRRPVILTILLLLLLSICFVLVLSYLLTRRLTKPISNIVDAVRDISAGNLHTVIPKAPGELGIISHNIDLMRHNLQRLVENNMNREKEKRQTELRMLQQQINPHFLNNTLNSIKMMATMQGARGIINMIDALAVMLKANLTAKGDYFTLERELSILNGYLYIQNIRFRGNIHFRSEVDKDAAACLIPKLVLQPIIENAVVHGIESSNQGGKIVLHATCEADKLLISIEDNGVGISSKKLEEINQTLLNCQHTTLESGIGMLNVHSRIQMLYGSAYGIHVFSTLGKGTCVQLWLPRCLNMREDDDEISRNDCG